MHSSNRFFCPFAALLVASGLSQAARAGEPSLEQLNWLPGCWRTLNADAGSGEMWMTAAGGTLLGLSRTIKGDQAVSYEFMRISYLPDGKLAFFAQPSGKPSATFPAIKVTAAEVEFENPEHEFPQRIIYRLEGPSQLNAAIEGTRGGAVRSVHYAMEREPCPPTPPKLPAQ